MTRLEEWTFDHLFMPLARWGFAKLHWPIFERLDFLPHKCSACGHRENIAIENGGRWTEQCGVMTSRSDAMEIVNELCEYEAGSHRHTACFLRVPVNTINGAETLRTHRDHRFGPAVENSTLYAELNSETEIINLVELERAYTQAKELCRRIETFGRR
jgi:hypothetical protein